LDGHIPVQAGKPEGSAQLAEKHMTSMAPRPGFSACLNDCAFDQFVAIPVGQFLLAESAALFESPQFAPGLGSEFGMRYRQTISE
jgi:hypothetical protein